MGITYFTLHRFGSRASNRHLGVWQACPFRSTRNTLTRVKRSIFRTRSLSSLEWPPFISILRCLCGTAVNGSSETVLVLCACLDKSSLKNIYSKLSPESMEPVLSFQTSVLAVLVILLLYLLVLKKANGDWLLLPGLRGRAPARRPGNVIGK